MDSSKQSLNYGNKAQQARDCNDDLTPAMANPKSDLGIPSTDRLPRNDLSEVTYFVVENLHPRRAILLAVRMERSQLRKDAHGLFAVVLLCLGEATTGVGLRPNPLLIARADRVAV